MLSLFKKKEIKPKVKTQYVCKAINYLQVLEVPDENKEHLFNYFEEKKKVYTLDDIKEISAKMGFDVWNSFIWLNIKHLNVYESKISVSIEYRLSSTTNADMIETIKDHINLKSFYTRKDIQDVSRILGFDVFGNCIWESWRKTNLSYPNEGLSYQYYAKQPNK